jgi:hypothetical protein
VKYLRFCIQNINHAKRITKKCVVMLGLCAVFSLCTIAWHAMVHRENTAQRPSMTTHFFVILFAWFIFCMQNLRYFTFTEIKYYFIYSKSIVKVALVEWVFFWSAYCLEFSEFSNTHLWNFYEKHSDLLPAHCTCKLNGLLAT